jgi:hypothetical protein
MTNSLFIWLHNRHVLSICFFKILYLQWFVLIAWPCDSTIVLSLSPFMSQILATEKTVSYPDLLLRYLPIFYAFSTLAIFLWFSLPCCSEFVLFLSVFRSLGELMLCWVILMICKSGSFFSLHISLLLYFLLSRLPLIASGLFLPVFWEHTTDSRQHLCDAVHGWLAVS